MMGRVKEASNNIIELADFMPGTVKRILSAFFSLSAQLELYITNEKAAEVTLLAQNDTAHTQAVPL